MPKRGPRCLGGARCGRYTLENFELYLDVYTGNEIMCSSSSLKDLLSIRSGLRFDPKGNLLSWR